MCECVFLRSAQKKVFLDCSRLYIAIFPTLLSSVKNLSLLSIAWNSPTLCVERRNDQTVLQMQLRRDVRRAIASEQRDAA